MKETASDQAKVEEDSNNAGQTCSKLQLQLLSVARVHEAMAEGLTGANNGIAGEMSVLHHHHQAVYWLVSAYVGSYRCLYSQDGMFCLLCCRAATA